jgi:hypothetical protein
MLTALGFRYPPGHEPLLIAAIHQWLGGRPGIGRIVAGMSRQGFALQLLLRAVWREPSRGVGVLQVLRVP